jgi:hypothetical protein
VAVRKHLPSLPGLGRFVDREPSHKWPGYFQKIKRYAVWRWLRAGSGKKARGDAKLFHLFDKERFGPNLNVSCFPKQVNGRNQNK